MEEIKILGIESSCDETAAAVVVNGQRILSDIVNTQVPIHQQFGGVVPEIASRKHIENIAQVTSAALKAAGLSFTELDAIAVTNRPGLIGALLVGVSFAKALAYSLQKPLIAVNHLHGHIYANMLDHPEIEYPAVCLVVSGGHTSLLYMKDVTEYQLLGETIDDAAGEAFDKVARFMGLGYPGGPKVQKAAENGKAGALQLPRVYLNSGNYDFSFSGLKTATMNLWRKTEQTGTAHVADMALEFQTALVDVLVEKTLQAATEYQVKTVLLAGGVAANTALRAAITERAKVRNIAVYFPSFHLCTDNAAMIAGVGYHHFLQGDFAGLDINAHSQAAF